VFFTKKPDALYAITAGWPGRQLVLRGVKVPAGARVTMLGVPGDLRTQAAGDTLTITMPDLGPEAAPCRHAFTLKIAGGEVRPE
jgi:alpha-L-fucosidase